MSRADGEKRPFFASKRNVTFTAIGYTFLWGLAFPLVKLCMEGFGISDGNQVSKCLAAGLRFTLSGLLTLALYVTLGKKRLCFQKGELCVCAVYGLTASTVQYALTYIGLSFMDGSKGAVYDQMGVFVTVLAAGLLFKSDRLSARKVLGCILGLCGIFAAGGDIRSFASVSGGDVFMIGAALCQTAAYFIAKRFSADIAPEKLVGFGQFFGGSLLCLLSPFAGGRLEKITPQGVISLAALILISSAAYTLSLKPLKYFPASEIAAFNLLITAFGVVLSALLLGENIWRLRYAVSLILCGLGILLINTSEKRSDRNERQYF